jgi:hypothetical protein
MTPTEASAKFLELFREHQHKTLKGESDITELEAIDFVMNFCETYEILMEEFLACKINPFVFYFLCRKMAGEIDEDMLVKAIELLNERKHNV